MRGDWRFLPLGQVCNIVGGGTPSKKVAAYYEGEIPWATVRDMNDEVLSGTEHCITEKAVARSATNIIPRGSVVIATRVGLGKVCLLAQDTAINQDLRGVLPRNPDDFDVRFLFRWLQSIAGDIERAGTGATVRGVRLPFVKALPVPVPTLAEQRRIAAILDDAFDGINATLAHVERNLANVRELFESYLERLFAKMGDGWVQRRLSDMAENLDNMRVPVTKSERVIGDVPYYGASGVVDHVADHLFNEELLLVSEDGANLLARTYPIAFSISGRTWVNNHAHVLRFQNLSAQRFTEYYLNTISLRPYVSGMAQPKLNQKALNSIQVPVPPSDEQERLVATLDALSSEVERVSALYRQKGAALGELKKSMLQKAFSGEFTPKEAERLIAVA